MLEQQLEETGEVDPAVAVRYEETQQQLGIGGAEEPRFAVYGQHLDDHGFGLEELMTHRIATSELYRCTLAEVRAMTFVDFIHCHVWLDIHEDERAVQAARPAPEA